MAERDLDRLIAGLDPVLHTTPLAVTTVPEGAPAALLSAAFALIRESEGTTLVLPAALAEEVGLAHEGRWLRLEMRVHSDLAAVGLTAAIATALAAEGISANVIAACNHDHVLVPEDRGADALAALRRLSQRRPD